jgi:hypothetical protein
MMEVNSIKVSRNKSLSKERDYLSRPGSHITGARDVGDLHPERPRTIPPMLSS